MTEYATLHHIIVVSKESWQVMQTSITPYSEVSNGLQQVVQPFITP